LHQAVIKALSQHQQKNITAIDSSMNGEQFWTKELGVIMARHHKLFNDDTRIEHPADCYGDLGVATGPILIALAASQLKQQAGPAAHIVCSSSDTAWRAALLMEKVAL
jgi:3-oxoacyl-[acyl-carrier-protein] synthase-1